MKTTSRRICAAVGGLALGLGVASTAQASPIVNQVTYSTSATIETQGVTGTPVVSFQGVTNGTLTTGQPFDLGKFVIGDPQPGTVTNYSYTPYELTLKITSVNGAPVSSSEGTISIPGSLYGSIVSGGGSWLVPFLGGYTLPVEGQGPPLPFQGVIAPPFSTGNLINYLSLGPTAPDPTQRVESLQGILNQTNPVPEPGTVTFFVVSVAAAWFGWFRSPRKVPVR